MGLAIVVSAMGSTPEHPKTTDLLLSIVQSATAGDMDHVHRTVEILRTKHLTCITNLLHH